MSGHNSIKDPSKADPEHARLAAESVNSFDSLTLALEGWFETRFQNLPDTLRQRVKSDLFSITWDELSTDQRRNASLQVDYQNDPSTEQDRQFWWSFFQRKNAIAKQIEEWNSVATPTASDLAQKEARLLELEKELARMEQQERRPQSNYYPERKQIDGEKDEPPASETISVRYIAYPKALRLLSDRLNAVPEEISAWVFMGPKDGGLAAYLNANELDPPPMFSYGSLVGKGYDYLSPLMACWFQEDVILNFHPTDRFITGKALIERWGNQAGVQPEAFIHAKIAESRLLDIHPINGTTQAGSPGDISYLPPIESGLFLLSQIEEIEAEDFGVSKSGRVAASTRTAERDKELQDAANMLAMQWRQDGRRKFSKREIAKELAKSDDWKEMTADRIERLLRKEW